MSDVDSDPREAAPMPLDVGSAAVLDQVVLQVVEEQLQVSKRTVDTGGGIRLIKRVHEEVVHVDVPLVHRTVSIERVAVGRDVDGPVDVRWEGDVMIVPVLEERLVWRKQLVLVEELRVTRAERTVHATDDVILRREEVRDERLVADGA